MKVDQVIRLLEAGYSKEEIQQMEAGNQEPQEQETTKPEPASEEPEQKTEPAEPAKNQDDKGPAAETAPDQKTNDRLDGIEKQLKQLVKTIQAGNVRRDSYGNAGEDIDKKAENAMAALISHEGKE